MDCGADDLACHLLDWFFAHAFVFKEPLEYAGGQVFKFLKENLDALFALGGLSFGVWRWWRHREQILHNRLEDYIRHSDARLGPASTAAIEAVLRPGRTATLPQPAFAVELREIFVEKAPQSIVRFEFIEPHVERKLRRALDGIRNREKIARDALSSLLEQRARAHLLTGVMAAARARDHKDRRQASTYDQLALRQFQKAQQVPALRRDVLSKECEAFQLLRLGKLDLAMTAYEQVENYAADIADHSHRDAAIARSKRFRAQIHVANGNTGLAWAQIATSSNPNCAVAIRKRLGSSAGSERLEDAEINYVAAFVANRYAAPIREAELLDDAEEAYSDVLAHLPKRNFWISTADQKLRNEAREGLARVERAHATNGADQYDEKWLMV